jgi:hypothetical protein
MLVSYFLSQRELKEVDSIGLWQALRALGYRVLISDKNLIVQSEVGKFDSRQHVLTELTLDIELLLKRFRIKK